MRVPSVRREKAELAPAEPAAAAQASRSGAPRKRAVDTMVELVHQARSSDEVQQLLAQVEIIRRKAVAGERVLHRLIHEVAARWDVPAADFLYAFSLTTARPRLRLAAQAWLRRLEERGIHPESKAIQALRDPRFYRAYISDLRELPEQQQLVFCWEMEDGRVQALLFLIDHCEMMGALKSLFLTVNCTKVRLNARLVGEAARLGIKLRQVEFAEARQTLLKAITASRAHHLRLPPQWEIHRGLIQRRILAVKESQPEVAG